MMQKLLTEFIFQQNASKARHTVTHDRHFPCPGAGGHMFTGGKVIPRLLLGKELPELKGCRQKDYPKLASFNAEDQTRVFLVRQKKIPRCHSELQK